MTTWNHLDDPLNLEFRARLVAVDRFAERPSLILDRSAFYGESGGQLGDRGILVIDGCDIPVEDCQFDADGRLHHLAEKVPDNIAAGAEVMATIAFDRRRDMMSQHTGQHLLSAALYRLTGAETVSSRLGSRNATIDTDRLLSSEQLNEVEDHVNRIVLENRPVRPHYPDDAALAAMNLRRPPKVSEGIRVLEIEDYDFTPCGGTHCRATGEIGPIHITGTERYKGGTRLHFLCGQRVLEHLREREAVLEDLGQKLGCGAAGVTESIEALQKEQTLTARALGDVRAERNALLADALHRTHPVSERTPIVLIREGDDLKSLRSLASALARRDDVIALVAGRDEKGRDWRVILERGAAVTFDAGAWFRTRGSELGGRGGGRPNKAEGRFPADLDPDKLAETLS